MTPQRFHVVELERTLRQDNSGKARDTLMNKLEQYGTELTQLANSDLAPDAFQTIKKLQQAVEQAQTVVHGYWLATHPN